MEEQKLALPYFKIQTAIALNQKGYLRTIWSRWLIKMRAMVAGTTKIRRPASKLSRKLVKEGVMTYVPWLGLLITSHNIDNCHPWKDEKGIKLVKHSIS